MQRGFKAVTCILSRGLTSVNTQCVLQRTLRIPSTHSYKYSKMSYSIEERGAQNSLEYRLFFSKLVPVISPFQDN